MTSFLLRKRKEAKEKEFIGLVGGLDVVGSCGWELWLGAVFGSGVVYDQLLVRIGKRLVLVGGGVSG